jgi:uncharacterized LabA/DUF88 family protein
MPTGVLYGTSVKYSIYPAFGISGVPMHRTVVFIDNAYLKRVQSDVGIKADYLKLSSEIAGGEEHRFRTYVYDCPPYQSSPPTPEETRRKSAFDSFKYNLTRHPRFEFRLGRLQLLRDEAGNVLKKMDGTPFFKQKGVDMALGIDMTGLSATKHVDKAIIVAGDSDFIPAIVRAKQDGILVTLYYSSLGPIHESLYEICDDRMELSKELFLRCKLI